MIKHSRAGLVALQDDGEKTVAGVNAGEGAEGTVADSGRDEGGEGFRGQDAGAGEIFDEGFDGDAVKSCRRCDRFYNALVLLGLERAGGVNETASGGESACGAGEDVALAGGLASEFFGAEVVADFGIACKCAGTGARDVAKDQVEL